MKAVAKITVEGPSRARLLSRLNKEGVPVRDFSAESSRIFWFIIEKKHMRKTFAILDELCYNYKVSESGGVLALLKSLVSRLGFAVAAAVLIAALCVAQGYVWRVRIVGNEQIPDAVIEKALSEQNISAGKKKSEFDPDKAAAAVRAIDGIKLASCTLVGTTVTVEVHESSPTAPPMSFVDGDITADCDATVTRVIARAGTPLVRVGQNVFAGTPLIGAYRIGAEGEEIHVQASGVVYGKVAYTRSVTVATETYELTEVSSKKYTRLSLFGLTVGKKPTSDEGTFIEEHESKFDVFLPIGVIHSRVVKTELRKVTVTAEQAAKKAVDEIVLSFIDERVTSGYDVTSTVREIGGGFVTVNVFIEAEMVIGGA